MPEKNFERRFGLVDAKKAVQLIGHTNGSDIDVVVFSPPEDIEWCIDARVAQGEANRNTRSSTGPVPDMRELSEKVAVAREAGEVPFSIHGPDREISGFLNRAGIAGVELIPPLG